MSSQRTALLVAALAIVGLWACWRAVGPRRVTIASIQARSRPRDPGSARQVRSPLGRLPATRLASGPLGDWLQHRLGTDLALAETTVVDVIGRAIAAASIAGISVLFAALALTVTGTTGMSAWWLLVAVIVAAGFAATQISQVRGLAERRRGELRRTINDFVQLIAVALTTNRSVEEAIRFAADAGDGHSWDLLRRTIQTAEPMGIPMWQALSAMAETYDLAELHGLAGSLERQADIGISVADTVRAEAKALRSRQLMDLAEAADKANSNLSLPTMGMVFGMVLFLAYPVVQQISQAFT
ncbi:MAG: hypothetical protein ABI862_15260 [Ilumatobacteraceae bacterium]